MVVGQLLHVVRPVHSRRRYLCYGGGSVCNFSVFVVLNVFIKSCVFNFRKFGCEFAVVACHLFYFHLICDVEVIPHLFHISIAVVLRNVVCLCRYVCDISKELFVDTRVVEDVFGIYVPEVGLESLK